MKLVLFSKKSDVVMFKANDVTLALADEYYQKGYVMHLIDEHEVHTYSVCIKRFID